MPTLRDQNTAELQLDQFMNTEIEIPVPNLDISNANDGNLDLDLAKEVINYNRQIEEAKLARRIKILETV